MRIMQKDGAEQEVNIKSYRKEKIKMMGRDFKITLTDEEIAHINELDTAGAIHRYCMSIINSRWG